MTCIVGLRTETGVYIGGDSAGIMDNGSVYLRRDRKVCEAPGGIVFGFTTSYRMAQIIRAGFVGGIVEPEYFTGGKFIHELRETLRRGGYTRTVQGVESAADFMVGHAGRLYVVRHDFQIGEYVDDYMAIGAGEQYALGALRAMHEHVPFRELARDPEQTITRALEIAAYYHGSVRPPFYIVKAA